MRGSDPRFWGWEGGWWVDKTGYFYLLFSFLDDIMKRVQVMPPVGGWFNLKLSLN
jgi:hypothetical protein